MSASPLAELHATMLCFSSYPHHFILGPDARYDELCPPEVHDLGEDITL